MADGTAANPGLPFALDLDTGFNRPGTNQLGISAGGVQQVVVATGLTTFSNPISGQSSAPTLPVYTFTSATGTGIYLDSDLAALPLTTTSLTSGSNSYENLVWAPELSLFVAVRSGSTDVIRSSDGITWLTAAAALPGGVGWKGMAWSPQLTMFLVVSSGGQTARSSNGIAWTYDATGINLSGPNGIIWAPGLSLFVVGFNGTTVARSSDGINWSTATVPNNSYYQLAWSPELSLLVIGSLTNVVITSPDAITWASRDSGITATIGVAWSPQLRQFITIGDNGVVSEIASSSNGITWTPVSLPAGLIGGSSVTWGAEAPAYFAVSGAFGMTSRNGLDWYSVVLPYSLFSSTTPPVWAAALKRFAFLSSDSGTHAARLTSPSATGMNMSVQNKQSIFLGADFVHVGPNGTESAPGLAFQNYTNMGFFGTGSTGTLGISVAGTQQVQVSVSSMTLTNPARFPDGTAGVPSISFTNDTDSGLYRIGANNIGIAASGIKQVDISMSGVAFTNPVWAADGLVTAPAVSFLTDTDSGLYRIGANNIGIAASGIKQVDISMSGVAFTNPVWAADGLVTAPAVSFLTDTDSGLYRIGANNIGIAASGIKQVDISMSGVAFTNPVWAADGIVTAPSVSFLTDTDTGVYRIGANNIGVAASGVKQVDVSASVVAVTNRLSVGGLGYLRLEATTLQNLTAGITAAVNFPTSITNTFGSNMGIASNNTFTNNSAYTQSWLICYSVRCGTSGTGFLAAWIEPSDSTVRYGQSVSSSTNNGGGTGSCVLQVAAGGSFKIQFNSQITNTISTNTSSFASCLTVKQLVDSQ